MITLSQLSSTNLPITGSYIFPVSCKLHIFFRLFANFYYTTNRGRGQELGMENLFQVGVATCIASPPFTTQIFRHHRKIKPLRKNGYKRTGIRHKFCCLFIPVRLSRECAIFFNGFILYFIPTLLPRFLLPVQASSTVLLLSVYFRFHRKQIHTVDLSTSGQVEYISLLHEFFQ